MSFLLFLMGLWAFQITGMEYQWFPEENNIQDSSVDVAVGLVNIPREHMPVMQRNKRAVANYTTAAMPTTAPQNNTVFVSNQTYYTSSYSRSSIHFTDLKNMRASDVAHTPFAAGTPGSIGYFVKKLKFVFPFYGQEVSQVVVTSAGFLHVGPIIHNYAHDVHYIAPLMANFTPIGNRSTNVYTYDDGSKFITQWDSVYEAEKNDSGPFTFQTILFKDGSIHFTYKTIPYNLSSFVSNLFKPKVGLADGYIYTYYIRIFGSRIGPFRVIHKYHTVSLPQNQVVSNSAYILKSIPNCISAKSCDACFSKTIAKNFKCKWCRKLQKCSDSLDWHRQNWLKYRCNTLAVDGKDKCNSPPKTPLPFSPTPRKGGNKGKNISAKSQDGKKNLTGAIVGVVVVVLCLIIVAIFVYGYRKPTSRIGMFMIENRPSKLFSRI